MEKAYIKINKKKGQIITSSNKNVNIVYYKVKVATTTKKKKEEGKSIRMAGRMVFEAQDASRIVNLHHLVILIGTTTTTSSDRERVLIDNL